MRKNTKRYIGILLVLAMLAGTFHSMPVFANDAEDESINLPGGIICEEFLYFDAPLVRIESIQATNASFEQEVLALTNAERASYGLPALQQCAHLDAAARAHSRDMAVRNFFAHTCPSGVTFSQRIGQSGVHYSRRAESIAAGHATPAAVVAGWMGSDGHRANILNPNLTHLGVGFYNLSGSQWTRYWTQKFGGGTRTLHDGGQTWFSPSVGTTETLFSVHLETTSSATHAEVTFDNDATFVGHMIGSNNNTTWVLPDINIGAGDAPNYLRTATVTVWFPGGTVLSMDVSARVEPVSVGDITGNGRITVMDVALLRTYAMEMGHILTDSVLARIEAGAGNINGSDNITMTDVAFLRTYVMGMGHTLPTPVQERLSWHTELNQ